MDIGETIKIKGGTDRLSLFAAFGGRTEIGLIESTKRFDSTEKINVMINELALEDGSGYKFMLKGYVPKSGEKVQGYINTQAQKKEIGGWIKYYI